MKLADVKERIDAYFESVSPKEVVHRLEVLGFEFSPYFMDNARIHIERKADDYVTDFFELNGHREVITDAKLFSSRTSFPVSPTGEDTQLDSPTYATAA